ncbi:class I SAM-dependent methyltransferase [Candidatus Bathyarchaeota archaeon]|nr:class I SAM-dependent methyltransferase [Candidatus Bathyarchaeota archaeon]
MSSGVLFIKEFYDENNWREIVEEHSRNVDREEKSFVLNSLGPLHGCTVLDAGCGYGRYLKFLKKFGFNVVGIDISKNLIKKAKLHGDVVVADLQHLPFCDEAFDASISVYGPLNHIPDISKGLVELKRVTRKRVIVSLFNFFSWYGIWINLRFLIPIYLKLRPLIARLKCNLVHYYLGYLDIGAKEIWNFSTTSTPKSALKYFHSIGFRKTTWKPIVKYFQASNIFCFLIGLVADI